MNLFTRLISGPPIKQLRARLAARAEVHGKLAAFAARGADAERHAEACRQRFFETLSDADFATWAEARRSLAVLVECSNEVGRAMGYTSDAALISDDTRSLLLAAMADAGAALTREVERLAEDDRKRMADAGLEGVGEHPALGKIRQRIAELAGCRADLESRAAVDQWRPYAQRYLCALNVQ